MTDIRRIAYEALALTEDGKNRNNITKDLLAKYSYLDRQDRKFLKRLIEGTIERRITIDHVLDLYSYDRVSHLIYLLLLISVASKDIISDLPELR